MINLIWQMIRVARPIHWVKNLSLFAAILLTGTLYEKGLFFNVVISFVAFSFATSATYIFNDIMDAKKDQAHPTKKNRPIASKQLPVWVAVIEMGFLLFISLFLAEALNHLFFVILIFYLGMHLFFR